MRCLGRSGKAPRRRCPSRNHLTKGRLRNQHPSTKELLSEKWGSEARSQRLWGKGNSTFGTREQSPGGWLYSSMPFVSGEGGRCSRGPTEDSQHQARLLGLAPTHLPAAPRPRVGAQGTGKGVQENLDSVLEVRTRGQLGGGGYTSLVLPLPLPCGTTRHAAAYHPCQPSPPGNVAAFSATPSGVPAAP